MFLDHISRLFSSQANNPPSGDRFLFQAFSSHSNDLYCLYARSCQDRSLEVLSHTSSQALLSWAGAETYRLREHINSKERAK